MTINLYILLGIGVLGLVLLVLSEFIRNPDLTLFGFFCLVSSALSIGVLLTL